MSRRLSISTGVLAILLVYSLRLGAQQLTNCCSHDDHDHDADQHSLTFVQNQNQWHPSIKYAANLGAYNKAFVLEHGLAFQWIESTPEKHTHGFVDRVKLGSDPSLSLRGHKYTIEFAHSTVDSIEAIDQLPGYLNFMIGNDRSSWASRVGLYGSTRHHDLYRGIDMITYSADGNLKYDFVVTPDGNPADIVMDYHGVDGLSLDADGALVIATSVDTIREYIPIAYQMIKGRQVTVPCEYELSGQQVRFILRDGYNKHYDLVIDPTVVGATLSGSVNEDLYGHCATYDDAGNIYTGGIAFGVGFRTTDGAFDVNYTGIGVDMVFQKFTPDASSLIYGTYVGGSRRDFPHSMIVNSNQELCVLGSTESTDYPVTQRGVQQALAGGFDMAILRLSRDATGLVGSTYLGGRDTDGQSRIVVGRNYGEEFRGEIILDSNEDMLIATCSESFDFPTTEGTVQPDMNTGLDSRNGNGRQDAVVAKLSKELSQVIWSTYLGSRDMDTAYGLREAQDGTIYVTGIAGAVDFPDKGGGAMSWPGGRESAYVLGLSSDGSDILYSTFWGSNQADRAYFIDIDEDQNINILGQTDGDVMVTPGTYTTGAGGRQFISCFTRDLEEVVFSTVIDGDRRFDLDYGFVPVAFMVDLCNRIYFSGYYSVANLPTSPDAILDGVSDAFYLGVLNEGAASLNYGTYYGRADHVDGGTSRFDKGGVVYQGVCSCESQFSADRILNTTDNAFATTQSTRCDVGVFKLNFDLEVVTARASAEPGIAGCLPLTIDFTYTGQRADEFFWDFDDNGATSQERDPTYTFVEPGIYTVQLVAVSASTCNSQDTTYLEISVADADADVQTVVLCEGGAAVTLRSRVEADRYVWQDGSQQPAFVTDVPGIYWVETVVGECVVRDSFELVDEVQDIVSLPPDQNLCGITAYEILAGSLPSTALAWSTGAVGPSIVVTETGVYSVTATTAFGCQATDEIFVDFNGTPAVELGPDTLICDASAYVLDASVEGDVVYSWQDGSSDPQLVVATSGIYEVTVSSSSGCSGSQSIEVAFGASADVVLDDRVIECLEEEVTLTPVVAVGDVATYLWSTGEVVPDITVSQSGLYLLTVTSTTNCTTVDTVVVAISTFPEVDLGVDTTLCDGEELVLSVEVENADLMWSDGGTGDTYVAVESQTIYLTADRDGCVSEDSLLVVVNPTPSIEAQSTGISCADSCDASIVIDITAGSPTYVSSWAHGPSRESIFNLCPDTYTISVVNEFGCVGSEEFVILPSTPIEYDLAVVPVTCFGDANGSVQIVDIDGGVPPYTYQLDGLSATDLPEINGLSGGQYDLSIVDEAGCELYELIDIYEPAFFDVWAGNDTTVRLGDTITIDGRVEPLIDKTIQWSPERYLATPDSLSSINIPLTTTVYTLSVLDTVSGCLLEDDLIVRVDNSDRVVFPNIFSPNGDGSNEWFFVSTDNTVERGLWLRIYDRWGSLIMERLDYQTDDPLMGWDGTFRGQDAEQDVYVFATELLLKDGSTRVYTGDVTLVR